MYLFQYVNELSDLSYRILNSLLGTNKVMSNNQ
jgi:hypothetical protein